VFDPTHAIRFDLPNGSVRVRDGERVVVLPAAAVDEAIRIGGDPVAVAMGRALGAACGRSVVARFGSPDAVRAAALEDVLSELHGVLSIAGLGALGLERWGRAMVLVVEHAPVDGAALLEALVDAALREATARDVGSVAFPRGPEGAIRLLVANRETAARARAWLSEGISWSEVLIRLQNPMAK
jgi:hypothetical protein